MAVIKGLEWTFDTVASTYEKFRPGYTEELYRMIFDYIPINADSKVVEIGIGGGQATLPILQTGCELTAVEYGESFSALCREKFKGYPKFSVKTGKFEDTAFENNAFDFVYSASAFHWVPEEIDRIYGQYYYKFHNKKQETPTDYSEEQAQCRAMIAEKYGFEDIKYGLFYRTRTFSAEEYRTLLGTYSDHIAIEETMRNEFFSKIEEAINAHGGTITIYDTMDLQLARKP